MLSKVAERMYWFARYLERVENTARMVGVYDSLLFDLPKTVNISWYNLVMINSADAAFSERYKVKDERNVVKFLLADLTNGNSLMVSLKAVRENVRTSRDVLPEEVWELTNELYIYVKENIQNGINRKNRREFLDHIIKGCQQINGLLGDNMSKDAGWQFINLGRNLERADMTSRILDSGSAALISALADNQELDATQVIWGHVLRSSSAAMNYRRTVRSVVNGPDVANFLLNDPQFPRSVAFCINKMDSSKKALPKAEFEALDVIKSKLDVIYDDDSQLGASFRDLINELQVSLADLHFEFSKAWFAPKTS